MIEHLPRTFGTAPEGVRRQTTIGIRYANAEDVSISVAQRPYVVDDKAINFNLEALIPDRNGGRGSQLAHALRALPYLDLLDL